MSVIGGKVSLNLYLFLVLVKAIKTLIYHNCVKNYFLAGIILVLEKLMFVESEDRYE